MSEKFPIFIHSCPTRFTRELLLGRLLKKYDGQPGAIFIPTNAMKTDLLQLFQNFHLFHKVDILVLDSAATKQSAKNVYWLIYLQPPRGYDIPNHGLIPCHILVNESNQKIFEKTHCTPKEHQRFTQLLEKRRLLAKKQQRPETLVTPTTVLKWLALLQPRAPADFLSVPGIGQGWLKKYFHEFR